MAKTSSNRPLVKRGDEPVPVNIVSPVISMSTGSRIAFAIIFLLFFSGLAVYLILYGKPDNSLHTSALSWAFLADLGILAALGFGQVIELVPYFFGKKTETK